MSNIHSRFNSLFSICLSGLLLVFSQCLFAEPLAMVTDIQGSPSLNGQPLALMAELQENAQIELPADSQLILVYYAAGQEYNLKGPLKLNIRKEAPEADGKPLSGTALMGAEGGIKLATAEHSQAAINMRSASTKGLVLLYPAWSRVLEPTPIFSWKMANGQDKDYSYRLEIHNAQGKVLFSGQSDIGRLRLPKNLELPRGERLTWELEAKRGNELLIGSAEFQVADEAMVAKVDQMAKDLGQDFGRRLVLHRYLKSNEFKHAADELWQSLVSERPELAQQGTH